MRPDGSAPFGRLDEPVQVVDACRFRLVTPGGGRPGPWRRHLGVNRFQFLGGLSEQVVFGVALVKAGPIAGGFAYAWTPDRRERTEASLRGLPGLNLQAPLRPEDGTWRFRGPRALVEMTASPGRRAVRARVGELSIDAVLHEDDPPTEPLRICSPAHPDGPARAGFIYARKTAGCALTGTVRAGARTWDLAAVDALGHLDWTGGFMARRTRWTWGCFAGRLPDGRRVGFNAARGFHEGRDPEDCFWLEGRRFDLPPVRFQPGEGEGDPWSLRTGDGAVDLRFEPLDAHRERVNVLVVATRFEQLIGRYTGTLRTPGGERLPVEGLLGYAERHRARW